MSDQFHDPDAAQDSREMPPESRSQHALVVGLFLVVVLVIMGLQRWGSQKAHEENQTASAQLLISGRYAVGFKVFASKNSGIFAAGVEANLEQTLLQIKDQAQSVTDAFCATSLLGELSGAGEALDWLDRLETSAHLDEELALDLGLFRRIYTEGVSVLTDSDQARLRQRHGWFGELALVYGLDDSSPQRAEVLKPAKRAFWSMALIAVCLFCVAGLGFLLFIIGVVMLFNGRIKVAYARSILQVRSLRLPYMETMGLFLLLFFLLNMIFSFFTPLLPAWGGMFLSGMSFVFSLFCLAWIIYRGIDRKEMMVAVGLHRGQGFLREAFFGICGYLAGIPIVMMGFLLTFLLISFTGDQPSHPVMDQFQGGSTFGLILIFIVACVLAPVLEEIMFRGVFYHYLRGSNPALVAALLSGVIFAAIHPQGLSAIPVLASIGIVFALIREWRGSLIASIVAHSCNNFFVMSLALLVTS